MSTPVPHPLPTGSFCYNLTPMALGELACRLAPFIPGVCTTALGALATVLLLKFKIPRPYNDTVAQMILGVCCPLEGHLDPPMPKILRLPTPGLAMKSCTECSEADLSEEEYL